jgi:hypothetical protein
LEPEKPVSKSPLRHPGPHFPCSRHVENSRGDLNPRRTDRIGPGHRLVAKLRRSRLGAAHDAEQRRRTDGGSGSDHPGTSHVHVDVCVKEAWLIRLRRLRQDRARGRRRPGDRGAGGRGCPAGYSDARDQHRACVRTCDSDERSVSVCRWRQSVVAVGPWAAMRSGISRASRSHVAGPRVPWRCGGGTSRLRTRGGRCLRRG